MFVRRKELEIGKRDFALAIPPGEIDYLDAGVRQIADLEVRGSAELASVALDEIRLRGHLRAPMEADCGRCLDPAPLTIDCDFDRNYLPGSWNGDGGGDVPVSESDAAAGFYDGDGVELNDIVREQVLLSLPMRTLCRADCKGICPVCGANRNQTSCGCREDPADGRWAILHRIRQ